MLYMNIGFDFTEIRELSDEEWEAQLSRFTEEVYTYAYAHGGRLSGEHGIGSKKAGFLERFTPPGELALMRAIKKAWDPNLILNPGKVFDVKYLYADFKKREGFKRSIELAKKYDLIFHDGFAPYKQSVLWSEDFIKKIADSSIRFNPILFIIRFRIRIRP